MADPEDMNVDEMRDKLDTLLSGTITAEDIKNAEDLLDLRKDSAEMAKKEADRVGRIKDIQEDMHKIRQQKVRLLEDAVEKAKELEKKDDLLLRNLEEEANLTQDQKERLEEILMERIREKDAVYDIQVVLEEMVELQQRRNENLRNAQEQMQLTAETLTGVSEKWQDTAWGAMAKGLKEAEDSSDFIEQIIGSLSTQFTLENILGSTVQKFIEATAKMAQESDKAAASLVQATGAGQRYKEIVHDLTYTHNNLTLSAQELGRAVTTLYEEYGLVNALADQQIKKMSKHLSIMDRLGVSQQAAASNLDFFRKTMGKSEDEAIAMNVELFKFGKRLGFAGGLVEQFSSQLSELAKFGEDSTEVMKGIAKQSAETGASIDKMTNFASQFDTFDDAANAAGRLNSILGGQLVNSIDLMMAKEDERIKMMRKVIRRSGIQFDQLNRHARKSVARAAGIKDMAFAQKLFTAEMGKANEVLADHNQKQANMEAMARRSSSMMKKLKHVAFILTLPFGELLDVLHLLTNGLLDLAGGIKNVTNWMDGLVGTVVGASVAIVSLYGIYHATIWAISGAFSAAVEKMSEAGAEAIDDLGDAARGSAKALTSLGFSFLMMGAAIGTAAYGLATMIDSLSTFVEMASSTGQALGVLAIAMVGLVASIYVLSPALSALGAVATATGAPLYVVAGALLAMGSSVAIAAAGFSLLVYTMSGLVESIGQAIDSLTRFVSVAASLENTHVFYNMAGGISEIASALDALPTSKMNKLRSILQASGKIGGGKFAITEFVKGATRVNKKDVENVKKLVSESKEYHNMIMREASADIDMGALGKLIKEIADSQQGGGGKKGAGGGTKRGADSLADKIVLQIGRKRFEAYVKEIIGREVSDNRVQ